jgi:two-component system, response regulator RegA
VSTAAGSRARENLPTVLVVDDDEVFCGRLARALGDRGFEVRTAPDGAAAVANAEADPPELAVVDLKMPGIPGLEVVRALRALEPATRIVVLTGYGSIATAVEAMKLGATHYLPKPADADQVLAALGYGGASASEADIGTPSLARTEWEHLHRVLADCGNNVSEAARRLGIHRRSLQRKLAKNPPTR